MPPKYSVQIWAPLLQHLQSVHHEFYPILAGRIASLLLPESESSDEEVQQDSSYDLCIARWAKWIIEVSSSCDSTPSDDLRREIALMLMQSLGHLMPASDQQRKT